MKTLLVGLDNHRKDPPHRALWPIPDTTIGARLMHLIDEHVEEDYRPGAFVLDFARMNLYPMRRAPNGHKIDQDIDALGHILAAAEIIKVTDVVLLGNRLRKAFAKMTRETSLPWQTDPDWLEACVLENERTILRVWCLPLPDKINDSYLKHKDQMGNLLAKLRNRNAIPYRGKQVEEVIHE